MARIRSAVLRIDYVVTLHAKQELQEDELTLLELEKILLDGTIVERQTDLKTGEAKYRVRGSIPGEEVEAIVKFGPDDCPVIITVYTL